MVDFWTMVYEQGVEVVVTLSSETEVGKVGYILYVPHVLSLATQSPLPVTLVYFLTMVYEQGVEVVVTQFSETEMER